MGGLRRRDLDLTEGVVLVRQAVTRTKGQMHVGAPKTAAGVRDVSIPPHLIPYLAKYVAALPVTGCDGFLFPGGDGVSPMSEKALRYAYGKARKVIGREDLTFHDMRHSAASLASMTGATTAGLKAMMGHAAAGGVERYQHATRRASTRPGLPDGSRTAVPSVRSTRCSARRRNSRPPFLCCTMSHRLGGREALGLIRLTGLALP
ncbi:MAG TPA: tyrosine-type recombinase/integrase [Propionicimonas sp.]|nr:tyrosine-type recombinase/integrase [Propionicimonas sp.]